MTVTPSTFSKPFAVNRDIQMHHSLTNCLNLSTFATLLVVDQHQLQAQNKHAYSLSHTHAHCQCSMLRRTPTQTTHFKFETPSHLAVQQRRHSIDFVPTTTLVRKTEITVARAPRPSPELNLGTPGRSQCINKHDMQHRQQKSHHVQQHQEIKPARVQRQRELSRHLPTPTPHTCGVRLQALGE